MPRRSPTSRDTCAASKASAGLLDQPPANLGRTGYILVVQVNGWTTSNAVPSGSKNIVAHCSVPDLNDAGYLVGPIVSLIWYVIVAAAFCTEAVVSVFDFFSEAFTEA